MTESANLLGPALLGAKILFLLLLYLFIWRMVRRMSQDMSRGAEPVAMPAVASSPVVPPAVPASRPAAPQAPAAAAPPPPVAPPPPAEASESRADREFDYLVDQLEPRLVVQHSAVVDDGSVFKLSGGATIGRSPGSDIVLPDDYVSQTHARVFARRQFFFIEDLGSTNGTFIDGRRIEAEHQIKPGQEMVIGDTIFRYEE